MLSGALFMLEIYDRVLPSRSVPTLVALLMLVTGLYAAQGIIDTIRSRILVRVGNSLDEAMSMRVYDAIVRLPLKIGSRATARSRSAISTPCAAFCPASARWRCSICRGCRSIWSSVSCFIPISGSTALAGAVVLVTLTVAHRIDDAAADPQPPPNSPRPATR